MTRPCDMCPFLKTMKEFSLSRLIEFARGEFHCHKTGGMDEEESKFIPSDNSLHCAGALIFLEKRNRPHQMMRICERLGMYDRTKLDQSAFARVR